MVTKRSLVACSLLGSLFYHGAVLANESPESSASGGSAANESVATAPATVAAAAASPSTFSDVDQAVWLDRHHFFRMDALPYQAKDMLKLKWSVELASKASEAAKTCDSASSPGKNAHFYSGQGDLIDECMKEWAVNMALTCVSKLKHPKEGEDVGPGATVNTYSQIVWGQTSQLGCGWATCDSKQLVVCQYDPAGNVEGQAWYHHGRQCSACPNGTTCKRGLCVDNSMVDQPEQTVAPGKSSHQVFPDFIKQITQAVNSDTSGNEATQVTAMPTPTPTPIPTPSPATTPTPTGTETPQPSPVSTNASTRPTPTPSSSPSASSNTSTSPSPSPEPSPSPSPAPTSSVPPTSTPKLSSKTSPKPFSTSKPTSTASPSPTPTASPASSSKASPMPTSTPTSSSAPTPSSTPAPSATEGGAGKDADHSKTPQDNGVGTVTSPTMAPGTPEASGGLPSASPAPTPAPNISKGAGSVPVAGKESEARQVNAKSSGSSISPTGAAGIAMVVCIIGLCGAVLISYKKNQRRQANIFQRGGLSEIARL